MPKAFDGFSFDLLAFMRRERGSAAGREGLPAVKAADEESADEKRQRREQEEVAFWGLVAFPVL